MSAKKIVSAVLIMALIVTLFSGCFLKPKKKNDPSDPNQQNQNNATEQQTTAGGAHTQDTCCCRQPNRRISTDSCRLPRTLLARRE